MNRIKYYVLACILALSAANAHSDDLRLALGGWSKHVPSSDSVTNETHNIVGIEYHSWAAGYFKNSYGRDTYFVSHVWRKPIAQDFAMSWAVGVSRGYQGCFQGDDNNGADFCPYGYIGIEYDKYVIVPTIKWAPGVFVFSPEITF